VVVSLPRQALSREGRPGLFGKIPAHGDFVARGLDARTRERWDVFLSDGLARAQERLGDGFEAAHDGAPAWRFVLGPEGPGDGWTAGAFAPSMDRAGRRFAIVAMMQGLDGEAPCVDAAADAMEEVIFQALETGVDTDGLLGLIVQSGATLPPSASQGEVPEARWWTLGGFSHAPDKVICDSLDPALIERAWTPAVLPA
jgi:type VI secretion system protein ImpM